MYSSQSKRTRRLLEAELEQRKEEEEATCVWSSLNVAHMSLLNSTFTHVLIEFCPEDRDGFASRHGSRSHSSSPSRSPVGSPFSSDSSESDPEDSEFSDDDYAFEFPYPPNYHSHPHPTLHQNLPGALGRKRRSRMSVTPKPQLHPQYLHRRFPSSEDTDVDEDDPFAAHGRAASFFRSQRRGSTSSTCPPPIGRRGRTRNLCPVGSRSLEAEEETWIENSGPDRQVGT